MKIDSGMLFNKDETEDYHLCWNPSFGLFIQWEKVNIISDLFQKNNHVIKSDPKDKSFYIKNPKPSMR